jgi:periplasmic protein TonB
MIKTTLTLITILFISLKSFSQTTDSLIVNGDKIFYKVEREAMFPGGPEGWRKYLEENLNADLASKYIKLKRNEKLMQQTAKLQFIVDREGNISNVRCINANEIHPKLVKESVRVIQEGPKWVPAWQNGKNVIYQAIQYITWQVTTE